MLKSILAILTSMILMCSSAVAAGITGSVPAPGSMNLQPHAVQPKLKTRPVLNPKVGQTTQKKKSTQKKSNRSSSPVATIIVKPMVHPDKGAIIRKPQQNATVGLHISPTVKVTPRKIPKISTPDPIPQGKIKESGLGRSAGGFDGKGGFVHRASGFAPLGTTPQAPSLVDRARQEVGGGKHSPDRVGVVPHSGGGASGHATESGVPEAGVTTSPDGSTVHIDYGDGTGLETHTDHQGRTTTESVT